MNCYEMRASHTWERQKTEKFFRPLHFLPVSFAFYPNPAHVPPNNHIIFTGRAFLLRSTIRTANVIPTRGINTRNFRPKVEHPRDARVSNNVYIKQSSYKQDSLIGNPRDSTQERSHVDSSAYFAVYKLHAYQECGVCPGSKRTRIRESVPPSRRRSLQLVSAIKILE